jgi:hypothetical protein
MQPVVLERRNSSKFARLVAAPIHGTCKLILSISRQVTELGAYKIYKIWLKK